jgi:hypothetical protein
LSELLTRGGGRLRAIHQPGGYDCGAGLAESLLHRPLVAFEPVPQTWKLRPVGRQPDSKDTGTTPGLNGTAADESRLIFSS